MVLEDPAAQWYALEQLTTPPPPPPLPVNGGRISCEGENVRGAGLGVAQDVLHF
jgi:hypothetical protein